MRIIFQCDINQKTKNCYLFVLKSEKSYEKGALDDNEVLILSNPNKILYGICLMTDDYYETTTAISSERSFWSFKRVICFVTYFPFMKLFLDIFFEIIS